MILVRCLVDCLGLKVEVLQLTTILLIQLEGLQKIFILMHRGGPAGVPWRAGAVRACGCRAAVRGHRGLCAYAGWTGKYPEDGAADHEKPYHYGIRLRR